MRKLKTTNEAKKKQNEGAAADDDRIQEAPTGFVRVRARRGQATDSHSLAERVRTIHHHCFQKPNHFCS